MACFLAPTAEAIIVSVIKKNAQKKEEAALKNGTASAETVSKAVYRGAANSAGSIRCCGAVFSCSPSSIYGMERWSHGLHS